MEMIEIKNLTKKYGEKTVYENFNLQLEEEKITVILGESGSGKTTLLSVLAGLTDYEGSVSDVSSVSMVFQNNRLVPNLTVEENIKLICPDANVLEALLEIGLGDCLTLYPKSLSAGMARRVAVLRALLYPSNLLLMDEPLINLDLAHKYSLMDIIKKRQKEERRTVVFVTHDIKEAVYMADRIVVLKNGKVVCGEKSVTKKTENELFSLMLSLGNV